MQNCATALLSVSDKAGIVEFARELAGLGISLAPSALGWGMLLLGVPCLCAGFAWIAARTAVQVTLRRMP